MDNYSHIDNPATAPPSRAFQTLSIDHEQHEDDVAGPQHSSNKTQPRAPQEDTASAFKDLTQTMASAILGDKNAQASLENKYRDGQGVHQDYQAALDWYPKIAEQGDASAQFNIGVFYSIGQGMPQDYSLAMEWYCKAAGQGHADAQLKIGFFYDHGQGVPQDYSQAMVWYRKAADQGHISAQFNIGVLHNNGR
ncbi:hypothetical protein BGX23_009530, partial [Mortierella sp. AD031]